MLDPPPNMITHARFTDDDVLMSEKRQKGHLRSRYEVNKDRQPHPAATLQRRSNELHNCVQWVDWRYSVCHDYCVCFFMFFFH